MPPVFYSKHGAGQGTVMKGGGGIRHGSQKNTAPMCRSNYTLFDQVHNQLFVLLGSYVMIRFFPSCMLVDMILCHRYFFRKHCLQFVL